MNICCVDNYIKRYHSIIDKLMMNYKKQILIINIKINKHYGIYKLSSNKK